MHVEHPEYPGLSIVVNSDPIAGAFYVPKFGDNLSKIAAKAYGSGTLQYIKKINKSRWNMDYCVYRKKSTSCNSKQVSGDLAKLQHSFSDGAWLALCPNDTQDWAQMLGFLYPVIWVTDAEGNEPEDLVNVQPPPVTEGGSNFVMKPGNGGAVTEGGNNFVTKPGDREAGNKEVGGRETELVKPKSKKWLWLVALGVVVGGYYAHKKGVFKPKHKELTA